MNRKIVSVVSGQAATDGDGVSLKRILSHPHVDQFDPFLMLDSFGSDSPAPGPGFPWHPHRGMVTISYLLKGSIEHEDSMGNQGTITAGGAQWMKAASGVIHQETPLPGSKGIRGFQFWLNLPASEKMSDPDYGDIQSDEFAVVEPNEGGAVKVIAGEFGGEKGLLGFVGTEPEFYDISLEKGRSISIETSIEKNFFLVGIAKGAVIDGEAVNPHEASLLSGGDSVMISAREDSRVLLVGGNKLKESVAWSGPIVMNTQAELRMAFDELKNGSFVK